jgi:hypothetical protein
VEAVGRKTWVGALVALAFCLAGCRLMPGGDPGLPAGALNPVPAAEAAGEVKPGPQRERALLTEEIKDFIYQANREAYEMGVRGFEEVLQNREKTPFSHYEALLLCWYSPEIVARLEDFYENHLWEWGYEMGFAFPLHTWEQTAEGFQSLEPAGENRFRAAFLAQTGHEEWRLLSYTLERQPGGFWLIISLEEAGCSGQSCIMQGKKKDFACLCGNVISSKQNL